MFTIDKNKTQRFTKTEQKLYTLQIPHKYIRSGVRSEIFSLKAQQNFVHLYFLRIKG